MLSGSEEATPSTVYHCVLRGLERLLLSEQLSRLDAESLVKLSVDRVNVHSPHRAMAALGLMLTCMYTGEGAGPTGVWATDGSPVAAPRDADHSPRGSRGQPRAAFPVVLLRGRHTPGDQGSRLVPAPRARGTAVWVRAPPQSRPASQARSSAALVSGKEKASPGRASEPGPAAPDSESVIVAMERVSVLFDR